MPFQKWVLSCMGCALIASPLLASSIADPVLMESVRQEYLRDKEIENCRLALQGFSGNDSRVLKMFESTAAHWQAYYLYQDRSFPLSSLMKAVTFAAAKHEGQVRKGISAAPYIIHPIGVAKSLWEEGKVRDADILIAALLHDTLEDTDTTKEEIEREFGPAVCAIVQELTNDPALSTEENKQRQIDHAPSLSTQAKLVKLADRLYNIRDLKNLSGQWPEEKIAGYLLWGQKLMHALQGTNGYLEGALQHEIDSQLAQKP